MEIDLNRWTTVRDLFSSRLVSGAAITAAFAILARYIHGVSLSGAVAGFGISLLLYACAGPGAFVVLVCVFILTSLATRLGYGRKQRLGTAEKGNGRTGSQVLANLSVAAASAVLFALRQNSVYLLAAVSALGEAAADTVSSEYGQAKGLPPRMITSGRIVPAGTDGAISASGTIAGVLAGLIVSLVAASVRLLPVGWIAISTAAAIFGMFCDSVLGATLESRHWLSNNGVNFLSTLLGAISAVLMLLMLS
jgi:uncharacterized protein (TIGR00297 family)